MKYFLIGEKLSHSYSAIIHSHLGLPYGLKQLNSDELAAFIEKKDFHGLNVTIPYKQAVLPMLDGLSRRAKLSGAVNTIVRLGGKMYGYNTDIGGMQYAFERIGVSLNGKNVLCLGSGGTMQTARALSELEGAKSFNFVSRSGKLNYQNCYDLVDTEILINATPVGTYPNIEDKIIDLSKFPNVQAVLDVVYNPKMTELLLDANKLNIPYSNGLPMLVEQALQAEDIWLNKTHSRALSEKTLHWLGVNTQNIYLCGMPSCGKTSVGKVLAERLKRPFIDTDKEIENIEGKPCSQIILENGEPYFRELESKVIKQTTRHTGEVIALGGGSVIAENNVREIRRNGFVIYIQRAIELLSTRNRPLSSKLGLASLYENRKSCYEAVADLTVENNTDKFSCVREILKNL